MNSNKLNFKIDKLSKENYVITSLFDIILKEHKKILKYILKTWFQTFIIYYLISKNVK